MTTNENIERRLAGLEEKMRRILDPETGVYPKIDRIYGRLRSWGILLLSGLVANLVILVLLGVGRG